MFLQKWKVGHRDRHTNDRETKREGISSEDRTMEGLIYRPRNFRASVGSREAQNGSFSRAHRGPWSHHTLMLDFWPPELRQYISVVLSHAVCGYFVTVALGN